MWKVNVILHFLKIPHCFFCECQYWMSDNFCDCFILIDMCGNKYMSISGFFSKFLMGRTQKNFCSCRSPAGTKSDGGGLVKKSDWSRNCPPNAKLGHILLLFRYFKHEIQLFKVLLSLKVVKFDTKMYLNFSNFWGRTSAGGDKPWSKNGDKCRTGGIDKFFARWGTPSPLRKNPEYMSAIEENN